MSHRPPSRPFLRTLVALTLTGFTMASEAPSAPSPDPLAAAARKVQAQGRYRVQPSLDTPADVHFALEGCVQGYANAISRNWLQVMAGNNPVLLDLFRTAADEPCDQRVPWAGEFAGKHLTGAVEMYRLTRDPALFRSIDEFVGRLVTYQRPNGYLGVWAPTYELTGTGNPAVNQGRTWDMWNHNHILLGLVTWYEESGDARALQCANRIAELFCAKFLGKPGIWAAAPEAYTNLSTAHALARLHRLGGNQAFLDLAQQVLGAECTACGLDLTVRTRAGEDYYRKKSGSGGRRWETLHLMLAYAEMHLLTGNLEYRRVIEHYWASLTRTECHNNGGFASLEEAYGNPFDTRSIETCCTVAYLALGIEALRLGGDSRVADQLEISTLNAGLAFFARDGKWSTYNTVMEGRIVPCNPGHAGCRENPGIYCCTVNAPRGIGTLAHWALMSNGDGLVVNWYGPGTMSAGVQGASVTLRQERNYPRESSVRFTVDPGAEREFTLAFRIPAWSDGTVLTVNGQAQPARAGSYAAVRRRWQTGDVVEIAFTMAPRWLQGEREYAGRASIYRGPVLLALPAAHPRQNSTCTGAWKERVSMRETQYFALLGSDHRGDRIAFRFHGDEVSWRYNRAKDCGLARVLVDGREVDTVDLYAENDLRDFFAYDRGHQGMFLSERWQRAGFGPGEHLLELEVTGERNPRAQGTWVQVREFHDRRTDPVIAADSWELLPSSDPAGLDVRLRVADGAGGSVVLGDYDAMSKDERQFVTWLRPGR
ncbi:MAG: glycoside hydrolase family 127 protein [Caulobacterales bacterium]|nr:glycoside hydrolase family 127 protein [Caulobacterales bacterium]